MKDEERAQWEYHRWLEEHDYYEQQRMEEWRRIEQELESEGKASTSVVHKES